MQHIISIKKSEKNVTKTNLKKKFVMVAQFGKLNPSFLRNFYGKKVLPTEMEFKKQFFS